MDTNKYYEKQKAIPYPDRPKKPILPSRLANASEFRKYADEIEKYVVEKEQWLEKHKEYREKEGKINEEFKRDLFKELGIENNPKAEKLYSIAWAKGHAGGLSDIWNEACDLVDLIK